MNLTESWYDSLERDEPCRKVSIYTGQHKHEENVEGQTPMNRVGCQPTISVFKDVKTFLASNPVATAAGS
jgi:hypothetical protein